MSVMDDVEYLRVVANVCGDKVRYGPRLARSIAADMRGRGEQMSAYRCPFSHDGTGAHWHIGHTPSIESMQEIADAIRYQQQEL